MARLTRKHRQAIARGVRRYWRRVKTRARSDNTSVKDARQRLKIERQEEQRRKRRIPPEGLPVRGWTSPDPEGEAAFNLEDRNRQSPPPWTPPLEERFRGQSIVTVKGYWEYRASPTVPAIADDFTFKFDPGATNEEFWTYYYEGLRGIHDEITSDEKYERLGIYVTRMF